MPAPKDSEPGPPPTLPPILRADTALWDEADMHALRGPAATFADLPPGQGDGPIPTIGHIGRYALKHQLGLTVPVWPDGAFYAWADCSAHSASSWDFCFDMMKRAHVAITPGRDFGRHASERFVRLSYASSMAQLQEAVERLRRAL